MNTEKIKTALTGAVCGAAAVAILGFTWGGWMTEGAAEARAKASGQAATVAALAPICASQFQTASDAAAQHGVFVTKGSWEQKKLVEAAGWAKMPGSADAMPGVAEACSNLIAKLKF
jgi:alpha/beta superfamily hydrolase